MAKAKSFIDYVTNRYGDELFLEDAEHVIDVIPTGSLALDISIGVGGIPKGRYTEIYGPESVGKAQPLYCKVLTPFGWKKISDLNIGDSICTPDGGVSPIMGIYPQGIIDTYKVTFSDGTSTECSKDHLWTVQSWEDRQHNTFRVASLDELSKDFRSQTRYKYFIPIPEPVYFVEQDLELDPYILGVLLGDGSFVDSTIHFSTADSEILDYVQKYCDATNQIISKRSKYDYSIKKSRKSGEKSPIRLIIEALGIADKKSYDKYIPNKFLFSSVAQRIELLQGLMDTDGTVSNKNNGGLSFTSTSKQLASNMVDLVRSLGGKATMSTKLTRYSYSGNTKNGAKAYTVFMVLPDSIAPFKLTRKLSNYTKGPNDTLSKCIVNIELVGENDSACIYIDHPDHLYITNDFIVTHNTTLALSIMRQAILSGNERILYIETENNLNPHYVKSILGDLQSNKQVFIQPKTAEDAFDIALAGTKDNFDLILFDSIGSLTPSKELEDAFDAQHVGLVPRIVSKFLRNATYDVRTKNIAFVFLNQIRANIGGYGHSYATPAGYALKHFTSLRIALTKGKAIEENVDGAKQVIGSIVNFTIKKNKVGMPHRSAFTNVVYGQGIDFYRDVINFGQLLGLVESRGAYLSFEGETISSRPGLANAIDALKESPEILDKIVKACYNTAGLNNTLTSEDDD